MQFRKQLTSKYREGVGTISVLHTQPINIDSLPLMLSVKLATLPSVNVADDLIGFHYFQGTVALQRKKLLNARAK